MGYYCVVKYRQRNCDVNVFTRLYSPGLTSGRERARFAHRRCDIIASRDGGPIKDLGYFRER